MAMMPPPPTRFSTTICWPSTSDSRAAIRRPVTSMLPPAAKGTSSLIGRSGQFCAPAGRPGRGRREGKAGAEKKRRRARGVRDVSWRALYGRPSDRNPVPQCASHQPWRHGAEPRHVPVRGLTPSLALSPRPLAIERQAHHHRCAGAERRADAHRAAVQFDQRLGDGEAQARALMGLGELAFDLLERPAELLQRVAGNADAGILDADAPRRRATRGRAR